MHREKGIIPFLCSFIFFFFFLNELSIIPCQCFKVGITPNNPVRANYFPTPPPQSFVCLLCNASQCTRWRFGSRLQAVPFWSVEMVRSQRSETGARRNKWEETFPFSTPLSKPHSARLLQFFALGYFARPLDYPERDCLQSTSAQDWKSFLFSSQVFIFYTYIYFSHQKKICLYAVYCDSKW